MSSKKSMIAIALLLAISILVLLFVSGNIHMESEQKDALKITFLKVGKADAIIAQTQEKTMVIDAGEEDDGEEVVSFLTNQGIFKVDVLIITHYDQDHVGGADTLVESLDVAQVFLPDYEGSHTEYLDFMTSLDKKKIKPQFLTEPIEFQFGDTMVKVEPPLSYEIPDSTVEVDNNFSLITTLTNGDNKFLLSGDAEKKRIREWISSGSADTCDLLKVPHHGIYNTALEELLGVVSPKYAVICSSEKNPVQTQTLELLKRYHVQIFQTKDGNVTVISNGNHMEISQKLTR